MAQSASGPKKKYVAAKTVAYCGFCPPKSMSHPQMSARVIDSMDRKLFCPDCRQTTILRARARV